MDRRAFLKQVAAGVALSALPAPVAVSPLGTASVPVVVTPSSYCGVIYGALMLMNEQPIPLRMAYKLAKEANERLIPVRKMAVT